MSWASPMRLAYVSRWFNMGKRWLVKRDTRGVLSALSFTESGDVRYLAQAWLRKAIDIVGAREGL
jgi:hypothetical protein